MANNQEKIENLDTMLDAGVTSASVDGLSTRIDLEKAAKRQRDLKLSDNHTLAFGKPRPYASKIRLDGFNG
jgi:hypothetical protein